MLLVCPPFHLLGQSSLSTALLATYLRQHGQACEEAYPHFELARLIGREKYSEAGEGPSFVGELLFSEGLHGLPSSGEAQQALSLFGDEVERQAVRQSFLEACRPILDGNHTLIGLTTSFHQLTPALFLAAAIKERSPSATIVLGGAACRDPMGRFILEAYPQIDYAVSGAGEEPLLALSRGERPVERVLLGREPLELDSLPIPDYDAYLAAARQFQTNFAPGLAFESSRGCWWGELHHCKFCGINGEGMRSNVKSSARVMSEVRTLWERHGLSLTAADTILARSHLAEVIPALGRFDSGPKLFYEVRSDMTEAQVADLARARVQAQPGLESLSTRLLQLLSKGSSAIRNLAFLKYCRERGVPLGWSQLYGIPGETVEDYDAQIALMQHIPHFAPPGRVNPITIARFSPYFEQYRQFGWTSIQPKPEYFAMHPHLNREVVEGIANYFVGEGGPNPAPYLERFHQAVERWKVRHERNEGLFLDPVKGLVRNGPKGGFRFQIEGVFSRVLDCTHQVAAVDQVIAQSGCNRASLTTLAENGILYLEGSWVLNLAVRTGLLERRDG